MEGRSRHTAMPGSGIAMVADREYRTQAFATRIFGLLALTWACASAYSESDLPENPVAFAQCQARVRVETARIREAPSLRSPIKELRHREELLFVSGIDGKWAQIVLESGDTAYVAAYLLAFPYHEILDHWKRQAPQPSVGKKAKVKWAQVNFRKYPVLSAARVGFFGKNEMISVLTDNQS
jgi:hypothetical protein